MNRKSKRFDSSVWINKAAPAILLVLGLVLAGIVILGVLAALGMWQSV